MVSHLRIFLEGPFRMNDSINPYSSPASNDLVPSESSLQRITGLGLSLMYYSILVILLTFSTSVIGLIFFWPASYKRDHELEMVISQNLLLFAKVVVLFCGLFYFTGQLLCLSVSHQTGSRRFAVVALVFYLASFVPLIFHFFLPLITSRVISTAILVIMLLAGILNVTFFILYIRNLSKLLRCEYCVDQTRNISVIARAILLVIFSSLLTIFIFHDTSFAWGLLGLVLPIGAVTCFVMYANLINALRKVLLRKNT